MDELEAGVDPGLGRLDAGTVIEVDVHLDVELGAVVVDEVAEVREADRVDLTLADLDDTGQLFTWAARAMATSVSWLSTLNAPTAKRSRRLRSISPRARSIVPAMRALSHRGAPVRFGAWPPRTPRSSSSPGREIRITSPDKVLFAERGETKLDLVRYYAALAEPLMRAMGGRPVLMQRFPKGAGGPSFFQKRVPESGRTGCRRRP